MSSYTQWQNRTDANSKAEHRIAKQILQSLTEAGYAVAINNGGDTYEQRPTDSIKKLFRALAHSDHDGLTVFTMNHAERQTTGQHGYVLLVWGNDPEELIADYSTNLEAILAPALAIQRSYEK